MTTHSLENAQNNNEDSHGHYDPMAAKMGMWLFLFTEGLLFGTLFLIYAAYATKYRVEFEETSYDLNKLLGAVNTLILLTSSLTMALAIAALHRGAKRLCQQCCGATIAFSLVFLVIKGYEWYHKIHEGIYPASQEVQLMPAGKQLFYGLYFVMTGIHGIHVVLGAALILVAMHFICKEKVTQERSVFLENTGLYWHLVDLVWIFLFPLFYLIH